MAETEDYDKSAIPTAHKTSHQDGGSDEISVAALSGQLADSQPSTWALVSGKPSTFDPTEHTHQAAGAPGGKLDHGLALDGLGDDDHPQYVKHSLATAISDFLVASAAGVFVKKTLA